MRANILLLTERSPREFTSFAIAFAVTARSRRAKPGDAAISPAFPSHLKRGCSCAPVSPYTGAKEVAFYLEQDAQPSELDPNGRSRNSPVLRRIAMPSRTDGCKNPEPDEYGNSYPDPVRRDMEVMSTHRQSGYHDQESKHIQCERHNASTTKMTLQRIMRPRSICVVQPCFQLCEVFGTRHDSGATPYPGRSV